MLLAAARYSQSKIGPVRGAAALFGSVAQPNRVTRPTESLVSAVTRLGKCLDDGGKCLDDGKNDFKKRPRGEYALSPLRLSLSIFYAL
jgi:hypothetical protein